MEKLYFASDYMEGAHPAVLDALVKTNYVSTPGYGEDDFCLRAKGKILAACECPEGEVHFLVGGTQTNSTIIDALLTSYQGVISPVGGHIAAHEAGAVELFGHKVITLPAENGKITASQIDAYCTDYNNDGNREHLVMPKMAYISQPTEYGTIYSLKELKEISEVCRKNDIYLFVDGARLAYALAAPENDVTLPDLAKYCDVFYIGGTKCGALFGEAVVIPKKGLIPHFFTIIKQHGALLAKGRLLGVQYDALFTDGLYEKLGAPAMKAAEEICACLKRLGYVMPYPTPTNQIFFAIDNDKLPSLAEKVVYAFVEKYDETRTLIRFATAWSSTDEKTKALIKVLEG